MMAAAGFMLGALEMLRTCKTCAAKCQNSGAL